MKAALNALQDSGQTHTGWVCNRKECYMAQNNSKNYPDRLRCHGCLRPKSEAVNPPPYSRISRGKDKSIDADSNDQATKKQLQKREARTRKRRERAGPEKPDPASPPAASKSASPGIVAETMAAFATSQTPPTKLTLPPELLEKTPLLTNAIKEIYDSLAYESIPSPLEIRDPRTIMAKLIGERGPTAQLAKKAGLEAEIIQLNAAKASLTANGDTMPEVVKSIQAKIDSNESALAKLTKDTPSPDRELKSVQEARSSFQVQAQTRVDREVRGAHKSKDRSADRAKFIEHFKAQLIILEAGLATIVDENTLKHSERATAAAESDAKVLEAFDAKIAALAGPNLQAAQASAASASQPSTLPPPPQTTSPPGSLAELAQAKKDIEEKMKMIEALQSQITTGISQAKAEFERDFEITDKDLPVFSKPTKEALTEYAALHHALQAWVNAGASQPFDWAALNEVPAAGGQPANMFKNLLGETNWKMWYPEALPESTFVVPRMTIMLVNTNLSKILADNEAMELEVQAEATKRGASSLLAIQESGKKFKRSQ
jgi:hypothetical protein